MKNNVEVSEDGKARVYINLEGLSYPMLLDVQDLDLIDKVYPGTLICRNGYPAGRTASSDHEYVHRTIMVSRHGPIPEGHVVDHIDGDRCNNTRENLRVVPRSVNTMNTQGVCSNRSLLQYTDYDEQRGEFRVRTPGSGKTFSKHGNWYDASGASFAAKAIHTDGYEQCLIEEPVKNYLEAERRQDRGLLERALAPLLTYAWTYGNEHSSASLIPAGMYVERSLRRWADFPLTEAEFAGPRDFQMVSTRPILRVIDNISATTSDGEELFGQLKADVLAVVDRGEWLINNISLDFGRRP